MLTTRSQKFIMFCIGFIALLLGVVMLVPFKSIYRGDNILLIEALCKLVLIPIIIILISIYPNKLKYIQVKGYREQSRIVSVVSYFPAVVYLGSIIIATLYLLTQGYVLNGAAPLGLASWNLWFVALLVSFVLVVCAYSVLPKYEMQLNVSEHVILDVCIFIVVLCFGFMYYIILKATNNIFLEAGLVGDKFLLAIYLGSIVGFVALCGFLRNTIRRDEVNINIRMNDLDAKSFVARVAEYNRAYNDIMDNFENYFSEEGSLSINVEEQVEQISEVDEKPALVDIQKDAPEVEETQEAEVTPEVEETQEAEVAPEVEETQEAEVTPEVEETQEAEVTPEVEEAQEAEVTPEVEETQEAEVTPEVEETQEAEVTPEVDDTQQEVVVVPSEELEEILSQIVEKSAQAALLEAEIEQIKQDKITAEQERLAEEAAKQQEREIAARLAEEKALKNKAEMQPSFKKLVSYVKSFEGLNVIEDDAKKQVRFLYGKKAFLVLTDTPKDYRLVFMVDPVKVVEWWNKNPEIRPRSNKKDNWFKLTNKGSFTEELLFEIVASSRDFIISETERIASEKAAARAKVKAEKEQVKIKTEQPEDSETANEEK